MSNRTTLKSWKNLTAFASKLPLPVMRDLFSDNHHRAAEFSVELPHVFLDYSKNILTQDILKELLALAQETKLEHARDQMFAGKRINHTEDRAVLHTALRAPKNEKLMVEGENISQQVQTQLKRMETFVSAVRQGSWTGSTGLVITDIVSIGVGGSNLGPQMVTEALSNTTEKTLNVHYVSNVDAVQISAVLKPLNPASTLFVVSSKTFTTIETMTNARTALKWFVLSNQQGKAAIAKHFVAVTSNKQSAIEFGIDAKHIFDMWDWVGGRFSLWSAIGLPIALHLGFEQFTKLLEGAHQMDQHFKTASPENNGPMILALISLWNSTFLKLSSQAILPYDQAMHMLPAYLQQAEMESNGKAASTQGAAVTYPTVANLWGGVGINGQHAYFQYLHQSNNTVPADFIGSLKNNCTAGEPYDHHHHILMANFFAQTQALMQGVQEPQVREQLKAKGLEQEQINHISPHKTYSGNRPTNTLLLEKLSATSVGALIALYEHKIFCQGVLLDICSFDQWGVELGKGLATKLETEIQSGSVNTTHDSSTQQLLARYMASVQMNQKVS